MVNAFDEEAWNRGAEMTEQAKQAWEARTVAAHQAPSITGSESPVDQYLVEATEKLRAAWSELIGNLGARLDSDVSKMRSTAESYSDTEAEAQAANQRFWRSP